MAEKSENSTPVEGAVVGKGSPEGVNANPQVINVHTNNNSLRSNERVSVNYSGFRTGLFDCLTDGHNCMDICLCHPCHISTQFNRVFANEARINWPMFFCVVGSDLLCTSGLLMFSQVLAVRIALRQRYNIAMKPYGGAMEEEAESHDNFGLCLAFTAELFALGCCTPCVTCQNHREMRLHGGENYHILFASPDTDEQERPPATNVTMV